MGKQKNTLTIIVSSFVLVILAIAFLSSIATQTQGVTQKTAVIAEEQALDVVGYPNINDTTTYTVTNAPTSWKTEDCPLTNFAIANSSGDALTLTTDYTVTLSTGEYLLVNNEDTNTTDGLYGVNNKTYVSYEYCGDDYISQSWGRSILNTNTGLFAIAILLIVVLLVYNLLGDSMNKDE